eukprot:Gregarina_sp_Poly_1__6961@NODE_378_length_9084_cov_115_952201_g311_i0_p6_GENE_NODE_378_length_9084_cov_115_952201_g311_i0NODE_378_length_9084_cov_115_952201_g311_i0_p6_ORF_typecomplete_len142_score16_60HupF_HypC/PF01455_18/0_34_NODE_378_length_9084_cov_115_952201_g311_i06281053
MECFSISNFVKNVPCSIWHVLSVMSPRPAFDIVGISLTPSLSAGNWFLRTLGFASQKIPKIESEPHALAVGNLMKRSTRQFHLLLDKLHPEKQQNVTEDVSRQTCHIAQNDFHDEVFSVHKGANASQTVPVLKATNVGAAS